MSATAVLDAMARRGIDVALFGREAHARAAAGARRLWLAGTRPFAPGCVVVRRTGHAHVLANSTDAVPEGVPIERLFGITWNPEKLLAALVAIPGLPEARRAAADGMTPAMHALLTTAMPGAELVDAAPLIAEQWSGDDPARRAGVAAAAAIARDALGEMAAALRPGVHPRTLRGICAQRCAAFGVTTPAFEAVASPLPHSTWLPPEETFGAGDIVVLRAGVLREGWEASLARTYEVGGAERPAPAGWRELVARVASGVTAGALRAAGATVYGAGRGLEAWDDDFVLAAGAICALEVSDAAGVRQDLLHVTAGGSVALTA